MKEIMKNFFRKIGTLSIEIYLISFILLNIIDFAGQLPGEIEFLKKILSWFIVLHLVLSISLTEIFFGSRHKFLDKALILNFSILSLQSIIFYMKDAVEIASIHEGFISSSLLLNFFSGIVQNQNAVLNSANYIGFIMIILVSLYCTLRIEFSEKSVLGVLHEQGPPSKKLLKDLVRFLLTFIVLNAFSLFVFKLLLEWFGWAVDAPLLVIGLAYWVFLNIRHYLLTGKLFRVYMFLEHVGSFGEAFLERFISLFHYKETFYIGMAGILVFHSLTDVFSFIIPYLTGVKHSFYGSILSLENHQPLFFSSDSLYHSDSSGFFYLREHAVLLSGYMLNIIAILMLMLLPAFVWYRLYKHQRIAFSRPVIVLFFISTLFLLLAPGFILEPIYPKSTDEIKKGEENFLMGVDIMTASIMKHAASLVNYLSMSLFFGLIILVLSYRSYIRGILDRLLIFSSLILFGRYIYFYLMSIIKFSLQEIVFFIENARYFLAIILFTYLFLTLIIYIAGYLVFFYYAMIKKQDVPD